uniref:Immunoglobulin subtype 2 domain-containing protein n=1 Tax=Peromyscus maniculatus bairdii TaxID=230844 RepID=A0A8C8UH18_PERMB
LFSTQDEGAKLNIFSVHPSPGYHEKPSLSGWPSHIVPLGQRVELQCDSPSGYYTFKLCKELGNPIPPIQERPFQKKFIFGPVTTEHAGTYRCYGLNYHYAIKISANSDPITGKRLYKKPSLSALMGPVVMSGENMTLSCISNHQFDMFNLSIEGVPLGQGLPAVQSHSGTFKPNFLLGPVIQTGNYRCYGSFSNSSHVWPSSSDPCLSWLQGGLASKD